MARFTTNKRITLLLALIACLLTSALTVPAHTGQTSDIPTYGDTDKPGDDPRGDPDVPVGPTRTARTGAQQEITSSYEVPTAGDGRLSSITWVWRLRVALEALKGWYLGF